jgi:O-antigen/teichoic acid export membrane protein
LQDDKKLLGETFGRTVHLSAAFTAFFVALFFGLGRELIVIVFGAKWLPALPLLNIYATAIGFGFLGPLVGAVLDSTGRPGLLFRLALFWTTLNWIVVPITTPLWGLAGFSIGYSVHVVVGNLLLVVLADKLVPHARLLHRVGAPAVAGAAVFAVARFLCAGWVHGLAQLVLAMLLLAVVHVAVLHVIDRRALLQALTLVPGIKDKA